MHNNVTAKTPEQMVEAIFTLDLEPIKKKLRDPEEGQGWSVAETDFYEREYKRFLTLLVKFQEVSIVPSREIDAFWHAHILDTRKYQEDCNKAFGYFLHHCPDNGPREEKDLARISDAFANMQYLYEQEFGEVDAVDPSAYAWMTDIVMDSLSTKAAFCAGVPEKAGKAAFCAGVPEKAGKAAFCAGVPEKAGKAAFCAGVPEKAGKAAFCAGVPEKAGKAAFCAGVPEKTGKAAFCAGVPDRVLLKAD